jgi:hypothetical protein
LREPLTVPEPTDQERLTLFCAVVEVAIQRPAIQLGTLRSEFTVSASQGQEVTVTRDLDDEEHVRSFLLSVRQLLMDSESVFLPRIANILHRRLTDEALRASNSNNRAAWKQAMVGNGIGIHSNERNFSGLEGFKLWAYGGVVHSDPELVGIWNTLGEPATTLIQAGANDLMRRALHIAHCERNIIEHAIEDGLIDWS